MIQTFIILVGPAGSGKSTLGREMKSIIALPYVSTGDILRSRSDSSTVTGTLASDDLVFELITDRLEASDCRRGAILDGYPRTVRQDEDFRRWIRSRNAGVLYLWLDVEDRLAVQRLLNRASLEGRPDDNSAAIKTRLADFRRLTLPIVEDGNTDWPVYRVDADGHPEDTFRNIAGILGEYLVETWISANRAIEDARRAN